MYYVSIFSLISLIEYVWVLEPTLISLSSVLVVTLPLYAAVAAYLHIYILHTSLRGYAGSIRLYVALGFGHNIRYPVKFYFMIKQTVNEESTDSSIIQT